VTFQSPGRRPVTEVVDCTGSEVELPAGLHFDEKVLAPSKPALLVACPLQQVLGKVKGRGADGFRHDAVRFNPPTPLVPPPPEGGGFGWTLPKQLKQTPAHKTTNATNVRFMVASPHNARPMWKRPTACNRRQSVLCLPIPAWARILSRQASLLATSQSVVRVSYLRSVFKDGGPTSVRAWEPSSGRGGGQAL